MKTRSLPMVVVWLIAGVALWSLRGAFASSDSKPKGTEAEIQALKSQVADLEHRAQYAEDYIALSNLQTAYGYYVDKCLWDQVADLFAKDGTLEIGLRGVWVGQDRVRAYLHTLPDFKTGTLFDHMQLQPMISIVPDGKMAHARWRAFEQFGMLHSASEWGGGVYENEYVKEDGVWKIHKLHYYMTYYVDYYKGWDQGGLPVPGPIKGFPPDQPTTDAYKAYPDVYVPPYHYKNPVTGR
jgi:hypothetical protein